MKTNDEKPETVRKRLTVYHDQTQPLIDYYTKQGILKSVNGTQMMEKVFADIVKILDSCEEAVLKRLEDVDGNN